MIRSLGYTVLMAFAIALFLAGVFVLATGATGSYDNLQDQITSCTYIALGVMLMCFGIAAGVFPVRAFGLFLSDVWDEQTARRRS